jgi:hypothetical protein
MDLPASHPKKAFIRRIIELETRLAYHERILDSLPEAMTQEASGVMPVSPEPVWQYESEGMFDAIPPLIKQTTPCIPKPPLSSKSLKLELPPRTSALT